MVSKLAATYSALLKRRPMATNGMQGAVLCGAGDLLAQQLEGQHEADSWRCASAAAVGVGFGAFAYPIAYRVLDSRWPGSSMRAVVTKALAEVATLGTVGNAGSIGARGFLEGRGSSAVSTQLWHEMPAVLLNELRVWLPYNVVAFALIPAHLRPGATMLVEACWVTYISLVAHRPHERSGLGAGEAEADH